MQPFKRLKSWDGEPYDDGCKTYPETLVRARVRGDVSSRTFFTTCYTPALTYNPELGTQDPYSAMSWKIDTLYT